MHLSDGILPVAVSAGGHLLSLGAVGLSSLRLEAREIPRMGIFSAALFTISLLHIPLGGTTLHPGLYGLAGLLLGKRSLPVIYVTLLFQSLIFQHGGLLNLGINTLFIGSGSICGWAAWDLLSQKEEIRAALAGFLGLFVPALLVSTTFTLLQYGRGMLFFIFLYFPAAVIEGVITFFIVRFFLRTQPGVLKR